LDNEYSDVKDLPVYEVEPERLEGLLRTMIAGLAENVEEDMWQVVGLRFVIGFLDHIIHEGMDKIFEIVDGLFSTMHTMNLIEDMDNRALTFNKRAFLYKNSKNAKRLHENYERALTDANKKAKTPIKRLFGDYGDYGDFSGDFGDYDYSGYEYCVYNAVYDTLIAPADEFLYNVFMLTSGKDGLCYGSIFNELKFMAEDCGILSLSLRDASYVIGTHLAGYMFIRPEYIPTEDKFKDLRLLMKAFADDMKDFDAKEVPTPDALSDVDKEVFRMVMKNVNPLIREVHKPIRALSKIMKQDDGEGYINFFTEYTGTVMAEQLEMLYSVASRFREAAKEKADVIGRLSEAAREGRGEDLMVALFTKLAHAAMSEGYRLEDFMDYACEVLDQVDHDLNPEAYGDNFYLPDHK